MHSSRSDDRPSRRAPPMNSSPSLLPRRSRRDFLKTYHPGLGGRDRVPDDRARLGAGALGDGRAEQPDHPGDHRHGQPGLQRHPLVPPGRSGADRRRLRRQPRGPGLLGREGRRPRAGAAAGRGALCGRHAAPATYRGCEAYVDYREILGRDDIDAVEVCTPDHWHAIPVIAACKAGKDIYCQKPLSLTIAEGRAMSYAVNKSGVVFQTGSQQRSDHRFRRACELVRNGRIGDLRTVRVGLPARPDRLRQDGRPQEARAGPEGLRVRPLARPGPRGPLCPGPLPRQLPLDLRLLRRPGHRLGRPPSRLRPVGHGHRDDRPDRDPQRQGRLPPDPLWNTATEYSFEAVYENGVTMIISNKEKMGVTFEGTKGKIYVNRGKLEADPKSLLDSKIGPDEIHLYKSDDHFRNFIDCVISRSRRPRRSRSPIDRSRSATWAISPCGWAARSCAGTRGRADHRRRRGRQDAQPPYRDPALATRGSGRSRHRVGRQSDLRSGITGCRPREALRRRGEPRSRGCLPTMSVDVELGRR